MSMLSEMTNPRHEFYLYDANDERVATVSYTDGQNAVWRYTLRDESEHVLRTVTDTIVGGAHSWQQSEDYVYRTGGLLAAITPQGSTETRKHFHLDHLGSAVLITDDNGQRVSSHKYWPFGTEAPGGDTDGERMKFTGHERDLTPFDPNGLDYMHARFYSSNTGRFLSVDPTWDSADLARPQAWNRYAYVQNNPMGKVDPDGRDTWDLVSGVANAIGSDNLIGAGRVSGGNSDFKAGQHIGDFVASVGGLVEAGAGTSIGAVGVAFDATFFGAIVGVPANVAGATMIVHGATTAVVGTIHMSESAGGPKAGSSGGPGAGKDFSKRTKDTARAESNNKCVFCGSDTTRQSGGNQSNIDHADPKARGGNNTSANAQNTCRTCNLQKATKTSSEFLNWLKSMF
jgi:RHS repeat-associated protein